MSEHSQPARILIVDDSPENRLLLGSQLRLDGYEILNASNGVEGIRVSEKELPDLILLDVMMPQMNGFEVCAKLKDNSVTAGIPIIMVTALREVQYRIKGIEAGADEFLSRPHHREELLVRVRSLIKLKRTRERLEEERNRLQLLYNVSRATTTQLDLQQMMVEIITHTRDAVGATKGSIFLFDENRHVTHKILVRAGLSAEFADRVTREVMSRGLAGWLIQNNRGDIIHDTTEDERWIQLPDDDELAGSAIGIPLSKGDRMVGVLFLIHPQPGYFTPEHLAIVELIGAQVTAAIDNAYLFTEISEERSKLEAILAQSNDAIFTTDEALSVALFNKAAETLFELSVDDVIGRPLRDIERLMALRPLFDRAAERPVTDELGLGEDRTIYASVSPIKGVGYVAVMQDVTQNKKAEEARLELERREKALVKNTFSRYMGTRLVDHVLSHEPSLLERRELRAATVMFADLRGFTRMIVTLEPDQAIQLLNSFFSEMTDIVHEFDGTIFDLAGDEVMVGFNVPFDQPDAGRRAFLAAVSMQLRFDELRQDWFASLGVELGLGVGIDQGDVLVGNVGARERMNFAMVGEAVNTAHRLVDIAHDGEVVVSEAIHALIAERVRHFVAFESMGAVPIPGKPAPQALFRTKLKRTPLVAEAARQERDVGEGKRGNGSTATPAEATRSSGS